MVKTIYLILFLSIIQLNANAQISISGVIQSTPGNEPVEFIHIAIKNIPEGTITNIDGTFELELKQFTPGMVLVITGIGYETKEIKLDSLPDKPLNIKIRKKLYDMDEVVVSRRKLIKNPNRIVRKALRKVNDNYPQGPLIIEGFYQDIFQDYDTYENLNHSTKTVRIKSNGFDASIASKDITTHQINQPDSFWSKVYYDNNNMFLPQYKMPNYGGNHQLCLLNSDPVRNHNRENMSFIHGFSNTLSGNFFNNHKLRLDKIDQYNGQRAYFIKIGLTYQIWYKYLNITNLELINRGCELWHSPHVCAAFAPINKKGSRHKLSIYMGEIIVDTEDFAILRFEYHNGYLHDRYKVAVEYQKSGQKYYPASLYLGNKCFINPAYGFNLSPNVKKGTIQCRGGMRYFNKIKRHYANTPKNKTIIDSIIDENTLNTPNTAIAYLETRGKFKHIAYKSLEKVTAYSKAFEDILYAFKLKDFNKILHHRILHINQIYKSNPDQTTRPLLFENHYNSEFAKSFKYIGDTTFIWYANFSNLSDRDTWNWFLKSSRPFMHPYQLIDGEILYYKVFDMYPLPVTSVDEYRYLFCFPKVDYLTDKNYLMKGVDFLNTSWINSP